MNAKGADSMSLAIASLLISAILFGLGLRGRRLGSHPVCRKCGYNLSGKPPGVNVCSECGADLHLVSAIRIGNRRRSWGAILLGATLAIPIAAWLGSSRVRKLATRDWEPAKPTFWVIHDLNSGDRVLLQRATDELAHRLAAGKLTSAEVERVAAILLILQPGTPPSHFDEVLELAREHGQLGDEKWTQYWRQAFPVRLYATRTSRPFDSLELSLSSDQRNWRIYHLSNFQIEAVGRSVRIGTQKFDAADLTLLTAVSEEGGGGRYSSQFVPLVSSDSVNLAGQSVPISVHLDLLITDCSYNQTRLIATVPLDLSTKFALPPGQVFLKTETDQ